jgi:phage/plasmid-like protein (TIGR03299 family)
VRRMDMATWRRIGTDVSDASNVDEVLRKADLDYEIVKAPLYYELDGTRILIPDKFATIRKDTGKQYGIVGNNYTVIQNRDAFDFINYISEEIQFEKAGETYHGLIYIIAKLPPVTILEDEFHPYTIFQNGHNGGISLRVTICPLRVVCENQFATAFKDSSGTINLRHTGSIESKLTEAREVLASSAEFMRNFRDFAESLALKKIDNIAIEKVISNLFPLKDDASPRVVNRVMQEREEFRKAYDHDDNWNFRGTIWGLVNAYSRYLTHYVPNRKSKNWDENRFAYVTFTTDIMNNFIEMAQKAA